MAQKTFVADDNASQIGTSNPIRVRLDAGSFQALVAGHTIRWEGHDCPAVEMILSDIGYTMMIRAIEQARKGSSNDAASPP